MRGSREVSVPPPEAEAGARLRRADRILSGKDFRRIQRQGQRRRSPHFATILGPGWDPTRTRLGLAISRRVAGAVGRNRVKRRLREWFRRHRIQLPKGRDLVIVARPGAALLGEAELEREMAELLER